VQFLLHSLDRESPLSKILHLSLIEDREAPLDQTNTHIGIGTFLAEE